MITTVFAQSIRVGVYVAAAGAIAAGGLVALRASAEATVASGAACAVKPVERVKIAEVLSGVAVQLADGRKVLLSGVYAPRPDAKGPKQQAEATLAKSALARLVLGKEAALGAISAPSKSGWLRAQLFARDGRWIQGEMVGGGFAWVRTFPDRRECAADLLRLEAGARSAKKGLWASPDNAVRTADTAAAGRGRFSLVEGTVESAANIGGRIFLNFGADYRTDFTVHVKPAGAKLFAQAGVDLEGLEGKVVRVRGFVGDRNGPVIDAAVPEQIEVLR